MWAAVCGTSRLAKVHRTGVLKRHASHHSHHRSSEARGLVSSIGSRGRSSNDLGTCETRTRAPLLSFLRRAATDRGGLRMARGDVICTLPRVTRPSNHGRNSPRTRMGVEARLRRPCTGEPIISTTQSPPPPLSGCTLTLHLISEGISYRSAGPRAAASLSDAAEGPGGTRIRICRQNRACAIRVSFPGPYVLRRTFVCPWSIHCPRRDRMREFSNLAVKIGSPCDLNAAHTSTGSLDALVHDQGTARSPGIIFVEYDTILHLWASRKCLYLIPTIPPAHNAPPVLR